MPLEGHPHAFGNGAEMPKLPKIPKISLPRIKVPSLPSIPYDRLPGWLTPRFLRHLALGAGALVCAALAAAAAWHGYTASQPEYALREIEQALREYDTKRFAASVDRDALAAQLARQLSTKPVMQAGNPVPDAQELTKATLAALLQLTTPPSADAKEEPHANSTSTPNGSGKDTLPAPPRIPGPIPEGLGALIANQGLRLFAREGALAIAATEVAHEQLGVEYPLRLAMQKGFWKWRVTEIANAEELRDIYDQRVASLKAAYRESVDAFNARTRALMASRLSITASYAGLDTLTEANDRVLILRVEGHMKDIAPRKVGFTFRIIDADGKPVHTVRLVMGTPLSHDGHFAESWPISLDMSRAEGRALAEAKAPLRCETEVHMMLLDDGTILQMHDL